MNINEYVTSTTQPACWTRSEPFHNPDLFYSPTDAEFARYTPHQHEAAAQARRTAEEAAIDVCYDCPLLMQCEEIALAGRHTPGVVAGRTEDEMRAMRRRRNNPNAPEPTPATAPVYVMPRDRGHRGQINDEMVQILTAQGKTAAEIAQDLGCSSRSVTRARLRLRVETPTCSTLAAPRPTLTVITNTTPTTRPTAAVDAAAGLVLSRVSPAMKAIYLHLLDREYVHRDDLIDLAVEHVTETEALDNWTRRHTLRDGTLKPGQDQTAKADRIRNGARDVVSNALSASARNRGRTERDPNNTALYRLTAGTRADLAGRFAYAS